MSEEVKVALLTQKVDHLSELVEDLKKKVDSLETKSLLLSGGIAVIVVVGTLITWFANFIAKFKVTIQ